MSVWLFQGTNPPKDISGNEEYDDMPIHSYVYHTLDDEWLYAKSFRIYNNGEYWTTDWIAVKPKDVPAIYRAWILIL